MQESEKGREDEELTEPEVSVRGILILSTLFLLTVIGFLVTRDGIPWFGKNLTDWLMIGVTASYVVVTYRMLGAIQEQIRLGRDSLHATRATLEETRRSNSLALRAWLLVESIEVRSLSSVKPRDLLDRPIRVTVRNYGKVPATSVTRFFEVIPPDSGWPKGPPQATGTTDRVIAAGGSHTFRLAVDQLMPEQLIAADQGVGVLFLTVRFTYTDALETRGDSSYCWFYSHHVEDGSPYFADFPMPGFGVS